MIMNNLELNTYDGYKFNLLPYDIKFSENLDYIYNLYKNTGPGLLVQSYYNPDHFNKKNYPVKLNPYQCCHNLLNMASHLSLDRNYDEDINKIEDLVSKLEEAATEFDSAYYFKYSFKFTLLEKNLNPPWYSSLCQAYALSAFTKLYNITNNKRYKELAEKTHLSFLAVRKKMDQKEPWITYIDDEGYLWFEKYPSEDQPQTRVLNGHIYAIMGLYSYYFLNNSEDTLAFIQAGMTTVNRYFNDFRRKGEANKYSLQQDSYPDYSPERSVNQQKWLYEVTGDSEFKDQYLVFKSDMKL